MASCNDGSITFWRLTTGGFVATRPTIIGKIGTQNHHFKHFIKASADELDLPNGFVGIRFGKMKTLAVKLACMRQVNYYWLRDDCWLQAADYWDNFLMLSWTESFVNNIHQYGRGQSV